MLVAMLWGCGAESFVRSPYESCTPGDACAFGTTCERANLSATGTGTGYFCTRNGCNADVDCPSLDARCIPIRAGATEGQCMRRCTYGCRYGTTCTPVEGYDLLCLPIGPVGPRVTAYQRCTPPGVSCRDGTTCLASVTPGHEGPAVCTYDRCATEMDCPGYARLNVACREQNAPEGLVHRCVRVCRTDADCAGTSTICVAGACE